MYHSTARGRVNYHLLSMQTQLWRHSLYFLGPTIKKCHLKDICRSVDYKAEGRKGKIQAPKDRDSSPGGHSV